jgi:hypothetical protein
LRTILDVLGVGYERWTRWPIEKVLGSHEFRSENDASRVLKGSSRVECPKTQYKT